MSKLIHSRPVQAAVFTTVLLATASVCEAASTAFDRTVEADARGVVEISNVAGKINVIGWDKNEVAVHARLGGGITRVDVLTSKGRTVVKVVLPSMSFQDGDADLEVRVPAMSEVQANAVSADLETSHLTGEQRLKTVSGDLRADLAAASFEAKTVSGELRLRGNGKPADMRLSTVSGDITLDNGAGEMEATSTSGNIRLDMDPAAAVRLRSTSGDLIFRGSLSDDANLEAETVSGNVSVRTRSKNGFEYEASTFSGDLGNCFGKTAESTSRHGPGSRLMGTVGDGKSRVRVKAMSGDVEICDR
jgi:DUF4097 and DUF4098 domain-containing protein YvlB